LAGGAYQMTPVYDILSAYPVMGRSANKLDPHKARMAMAVISRNRHYELQSIHRWHWVAMAEKLGLPEAPELIDHVLQQVPKVLDQVAGQLPESMPQAIFDAVNEGMRRAARRLAAEPDYRR